MEQFSPLHSILSRVLGLAEQHGDLQHLEARTLMSGVPVVHAMPHTTHNAPAIIQLLNHQPVALAATAIAAPSSLTATYAVSAGQGRITVTWKNNQATATGYSVYRAINASTEYALVATITNPNTRTFSEAASTPNTLYTYKVIANTAAGSSALSSPASITTPMTTPTAFTARLVTDSNTGAPYVAMSWVDGDPGLTGFVINRAEGAGAFVKLTQTTGTSFEDRTIKPNTIYKYQVKAISGARSSALTAAATITTLPTAPSALSTSVINDQVSLSWTASDTKSTGYSVYRSLDSTTYTRVASISGVSIRNYVDTTVPAGSTAYYKLVANGPGGTSTYSNVATAQLLSASTWSLSTRFGNELILNSPVAGDTFLISQVDSTLLINVNGQTTEQSITAGGFFIYLRGGNTLSIDSTVTTNVTVQSINGLTDTITIANSNANVWIDGADIYAGPSSPHRISTLVGNVSLARGASLPNPTDARTTMTLNRSLFSTGVSINDANQGQVGDCYFIATLAAFADRSPSVITSSAVDMGDGTYIVQFFRNGVAQFYRVNNQLAVTAAGGSTLLYARPSASSGMWTSIYEKAFAHYRKGANTYASLNSGYFTEVNSAFNVGSINFSPAAYNDSSLGVFLSGKLASGKSIELGTFSNAPKLVRSHAYTFVSVTKVNGVNMYNLRNPWGKSGNSLESSTGYTSLTYSQFVTNFAGGTIAA